MIHLNIHILCVVIGYMFLHFSHFTHSYLVFSFHVCFSATYRFDRTESSSQIETCYKMPHTGEYRCFVSLDYLDNFSSIFVSVRYTIYIYETHINRFVIGLIESIDVESSFSVSLVNRSVYTRAHFIIVYPMWTLKRIVCGSLSGITWSIWWFFSFRYLNGARK